MRQHKSENCLCMVIGAVKTKWAHFHLSHMHSTPKYQCRKARERSYEGVKGLCFNIYERLNAIKSWINEQVNAER